MIYLGSKSRISKEILPIILKNRKENQYYIEPFAGGMNLIDKVQGPKIANDFNYYLIKLFIALQNGWIPPSFLSKEEYLSIKNNQESYPPELVAFAGFPCSFGGKWFGGYAQNKKGTNYALNARNSLIKQIKNLKDCIFKNEDYRNLYIPEGSIVYLDPPYRGTTKYSNKFDSDIFWEWVRLLSKKNEVYISEYSAPDDFICIWEKEILCTLNKNAKDVKIERLYIYGGK